MYKCMLHRCIDDKFILSCIAFQKRDSTLEFKPSIEIVRLLWCS